MQFSKYQTRKKKTFCFFDSSARRDFFSGLGIADMKRPSIFPVDRVSDASDHGIPARKKQLINGIQQIVH